MKKTLALSSIILGALFLSGCGQVPVSQIQPTASTPAVEKPAPMEEVATNQPAEVSDETANWKVYTNLGITIKYPNDESYSVENSGTDKFAITQDHPGNRIHISKGSDSSILKNNADTKVINNLTYGVFKRDGAGSGYGYTVERNGQSYVFESVWGPKNEIFELMMTTIKFE